MKQKLLELLTAKFLGKGTTRKDTLARLASAFATQCTTEEEAQALIDKVTVEQVTDFEKEHRSEVDSEIAKATKTALDNAEKGKGGEGAGEGNPNPNTEENKGGEESEIAKALKQIAETQKALSNKINSIEAGKTTETRLSQINDILKDVKDETLKNTISKNFPRMSFENDESFAEYLTEIQTDVTTSNQTFINQGLTNHIPGNGRAGSGNALTQDDFDKMV